MKHLLIGVALLALMMLDHFTSHVFSVRENIISAFFAGGCIGLWAGHSVASASRTERT